jgi:hypothetical protein
LDLDMNSHSDPDPSITPSPTRHSTAEHITPVSAPVEPEYVPAMQAVHAEDPAKKAARKQAANQPDPPRTNPLKILPPVTEVQVADHPLETTELSVLH